MVNLYRVGVVTYWKSAIGFKERYLIPLSWALLGATDYRIPGELWTCSCDKILNIIAAFFYSVVLIGLYCYVLCFKTEKKWKK